jgi:transcriptional regulator with XRE-family HTH domain
MEIGQKIKKLRTEKDISMRKLGEEVGVSHAHISKLESGLNSPSVDLLEKIADYFKIDVSYFFIKEQDPFTKSQQDLLFESDLSLENIKDKYNLKIDGKPATDEEIQKMVEYIRVLRQLSIQAPK